MSKDRICNTIIHNVPENAKGYVVARTTGFDDIEFWYWGTFPTESEARKVAHQLKGYVFKVPDNE